MLTHAHDHVHTQTSVHTHTHTHTLLHTHTHTPTHTRSGYSDWRRRGCCGREAESFFSRNLSRFSLTKQLGTMPEPGWHLKSDTTGAHGVLTGTLLLVGQIFTGRLERGCFSVGGM